MITPETQTRKRNRRWRRLTPLLFVVLLFGVPVWVGYAQVQHQRRNYELLQAIREIKNNLSAAEARPGTPRADALIKKVTQLLDQGADPNLRDEEPEPSGFWATFIRRFIPPRPKKDALSTGFAVIAMLPRHWHNATYEMPSDKQGRVMISMGLVISDDDELVTILFRKLLDKGANVNTRDGEDGMSLLTKTLGDGYWDCAEMLIKRGANVNVADDEGLTSLHEAARAGDPRCLKMLLDAGANIRARNKEGETPLHYAVMFEKVACARLLADAGADIEARDKAGATPLMSAIANSENAEVIQWLLSKGVDIHARDKTGKTVLGYAKTRGSRAIITLLRKAGAK